jgi:outer membrane protein assembly factor BamE (lipoprotein component of BamABCDE complex)
LLLVVASATFLCICFVVLALDLRLDDFRPGIGYPPEQHKDKIKEGMTRYEVRSLLGSPHGRDDSESAIYWTYRCDFFGGALFRVHFGPNDRVTSTEWWLN